MMEAYDAEMPKPLWPALAEFVVRVNGHILQPKRAEEEYIYFAN
ncbi:MAG: hypothetical protein QF849_07330 [Pseudomonadales bacterium]|jgi:hypothetical protein|nr:hypothetical protein [Pseudomonadales bacterium]